MLKWSNSYAYIKITNEDFPQILVTRNKRKDWSRYIWPKHNTRELKNFLQYLRYIIKRRWCKKTQFNQWKICWDYHFGLCKGRCSKQIFQNQTTATTEYKTIIKIIEQFFRWNTKPVEKEIKIQIQSAIDDENFERAAKLRDIYLQIENLTEKQTVVLPKSISGYICQIREISGWFVYVVLNFYEWKLIDVIINKQNKNDLDENSIISSLESSLGDLLVTKTDSPKSLNHFAISPKIKITKKQTQEVVELIDGFLDSYLVSESFKDENLINDMLTEIQNKYKLTNFPYHMECIDISHMSGDRTSGGLSGFLGWIANYKLYRRYKIEAKASDDYEALKEVITRRFKNKDKTEQNLPDLFILDWGKGQLWILRELLKEDRFNPIFDKVDFVSLGKWVARKTAWKLKWEKEKIFYFDKSSYKLNQFKIKTIDLDYDQADRLLVKIRDEAHRFSNNYRKNQMKKDFK